MNSFTFGVITDIQYSLRQTVRPSSLDRLAEAVHRLNQKDLAFVLQLGDLVYDDAEAFDLVLDRLAGLRHPLYHVLGNHDFAMSREALRMKLNLPADYYAFSHGGWRFLILDGTDVSLFGREPGSLLFREARYYYLKKLLAFQPNARKWNGAVGKAQQRWLVGQLEEASRNQERVIVCCHYPLYGPSGKHLLWNAGEVYRFLADYPHGVAYFSGHYHRGSYVQTGRVPCCSFPAFLETDGERSFALVETHENLLKIRGGAPAGDREIIFG